MTAVHSDLPERTEDVAAVGLKPPFGKLRRDPRDCRAIGVREVSSALSRASAEAWESLQLSA